MWESSVQDQGAFSPHGALVFEAFAAVPSTGRAITSLITEGVGKMITAVVNVARAESHDESGEKQNKKRIGDLRNNLNSRYTEQ